MQTHVFLVVFNKYILFPVIGRDCHNGAELLVDRYPCGIPVLPVKMFISFFLFTELFFLESLTRGSALASEFFVGWCKLLPYIAGHVNSTRNTRVCGLGQSACVLFK